MGKIIRTFHLKENLESCKPHKFTVKKRRKYIRRFLSLDCPYGELVEKSLSDALKCQSAESEYIKKSIVDSLYEAIDNLRPKQKIRLFRYFYQEMTYEQIAQLEGVTKQAIESGIKCTINLLKKIVE